jgi:hypothetical protein
MTKKITKRAVHRNPIEAAITCRRYASNRTAQPADGVMRNFSGRGSYIETYRAFKPGTILIVRMLRFPSLPWVTGDADQPRTICLAEVKWQQKLGADTPNRYGIGLRYLEP